MSKNCCTAWFKGWWNSCCCQHDKDYYISGKSRRDSDIDLLACVIRRGFALFSVPVAIWMFIAVRLLGKSRYTKKQTKVEDGY